ncbi:MAG: hypothetical protein B7Z55_06260, partial [Planctomycetales bacterium 12-60-4]
MSKTVNLFLHFHGLCPQTVGLSLSWGLPGTVCETIQLLFENPNLTRSITINLFVLPNVSIDHRQQCIAHCILVRRNLVRRCRQKIDIAMNRLNANIFR